MIRNKAITVSLPHHLIYTFRCSIAIRYIHTALTLKVNFFDNPTTYSSNTLSENPSFCDWYTRCSIRIRSEYYSFADWLVRKVVFFRILAERIVTLPAEAIDAAWNLLSGWKNDKSRMKTESWGELDWR